MVPQERELAVVLEMVRAGLELIIERVSYDFIELSFDAEVAKIDEVEAFEVELLTALFCRARVELRELTKETPNYSGLVHSEIWVVRVLKGLDLP